jgi:diguanylate cyclase (GGDEF)-like protein/PAS domain S-box-containing protein
VTGQDGVRGDPAETALQRLADRHPAALFAAIDFRLNPPIVPVPDGLPVSRERFVEPGADTALVRPDDRTAIAKLWGQSRCRGWAFAPVRLQGDVPRDGYLYLFDLQQRHGVTVAAFMEGAPDTDLFPTERPSRSRPRLARASKDGAAIYRWVDPALIEMLGWPEEEMVGRRATEFIHPEDQDIGIANWLEMLDAPEHARAIRLRHRRYDGSWAWLEVTNHNRLARPEGDVLSDIVDVSDEMVAQDALRAREQLLAQLTDTVPMGLFHADANGSVLFTNRPLHAITGVLGAPTVEELLAPLVADDRAALARCVVRAKQGLGSDIELTRRRDDGTVRHYILRVRPLLDDERNITGLTGVLEDVTEMVRSRQELEMRASSDRLTGCLNREATFAAIQRFLDQPGAAGKRDEAGTAVIFIDLDGFKQVNDEFGHAAGDTFLISVADSLRATLRAGDLLGRLGGDEFVVVCPNVPSREAALRAGRSLARRAFQDVAPVQASIGVAWTNQRGTTAAGLLAAADAAMYEAKRARRGQPALSR